MQPSACLPWQPDHAANAAQEHRSYTTRWGTILATRPRHYREWGTLGIFIGRSFGPLRTSVPSIAGILEMRHLDFQIANFKSAFIWAWILLVFGDFGFGVIKWLT